MHHKVEKIAFLLFSLAVIFVFCQKLIERIERVERKAPAVSITIPEGFDLGQINDVLVPKLKNFNSNEFVLKTKNKEGYLFPDTYFFPLAGNAKDVIQMMSSNFENKIAPLLSDMTASGKSEKDIITMASIIERESKGAADRKIISGILWKRISINMPLQVDAAPETYTKRGLPMQPICNPGLDTIIASIHPETTTYLYYLHDKNGNIYYAKTFAEHQKNIAKYLK